MLAAQGDARLLAPDETPEVEELERKRQEAVDRVRSALGKSDGAAGGGGGGGGASGGGGVKERVERERAERREREGGREEEGGEEEESGGSGEEEEGERRGGKAGGGEGDKKGGAAAADRDAVAERKEMIREKRSETLQKGIGRCAVGVSVFCVGGGRRAERTAAAQLPLPTDSNRLQPTATDPNRQGARPRRRRRRRPAQALAGERWGACWVESLTAAT